jgi:hypothetical protein
MRCPASATCFCACWKRNLPLPSRSRQVLSLVCHNPAACWTLRNSPDDTVLCMGPATQIARPLPGKKRLQQQRGGQRHGSQPHIPFPLPGQGCGKLSRLGSPGPPASLPLGSCLVMRSHRVKLHPKLLTVGVGGRPRVLTL